MAKKEKIFGLGSGRKTAKLLLMKFACCSAYINHFMFAGCFGNIPAWYLATNSAGHLI